MADDARSGTGAQGSDVPAALLEMLDEAVILLGCDGTVVYANPAACAMVGLERAEALGGDVCDWFYAPDLSRAAHCSLLFSCDGGPCAAMVQSRDGSFMPVVVKCRAIDDETLLLVAHVDTKAEDAREHARLLNELHGLHARLRGTLSIISCATLGDNSFESLSKRLANELQSVMSADAAVLYLADDYGFTPYGVSEGFETLDIEKTYLPIGVGVPTLVTRNRRTTRLQLVSPPQSRDSGAIMLDIDSDTRFRLRSMLAECCSTIVGTPVFSYDRIVAVAIAGWLSPHLVTADDVRLLDTVADFLSVEFSAAVTQLEQKRASGFAAAMNEVRELVRAAGEMSSKLVSDIAHVVGRVVPSRIVFMESSHYDGTTFVHLNDVQRGGLVDTLEYPHGIREVFGGGEPFVAIDADSPCGMWLGRHTDLQSGYGVLLTASSFADEPLQEALLVMRGAHDHPFDDSEQSFLRSLAREVGNVLHAEQERAHDVEISRALQVGLRNELPDARGVTTASLYISATESAVVGGDFFDLCDLSDGHLVVMMGDVSGKGVEAAAMASLVKTALAAYAWNYMNPADMVSSLNNLFLNFSRLETFSSLVVVAIDFATCSATYCSAGHPPAMLVHRPETATAELELLTVQSPIVGAFEGLTYSNGTFEFGLGDILYLYTDGTTEARSATGEFFGEEALRETLLRVCHQGVEGVPRGVLDTVEQFAGGELHDDIAMVAVRFDGIDSSGPLTIPCMPSAPQDGVEVD